MLKIYPKHPKSQLFKYIFRDIFRVEFVNHKGECPLQWYHNERDDVSNHQPHDCLLNRLFRRRSKKTSTHRVTGLCVGNSPATGEFPAQRASNAENVTIWWRHQASPYNTSHEMMSQRRCALYCFWYQQRIHVKYIPILFSVASLKRVQSHGGLCVSVPAN